MIALSASKITTYLQCPRRFKLRYIMRLAPAWKPAALALGSAVHGALETFHQQRAIGASMTPDAVGALFRIDWASEQIDDLKYDEDETATDLAATGERLVKMYAVANQNVEVHGAEVPFELPVTDGVVLRGVFDVLLAGDRVREMKTAARNFDAGTLQRHIQVSAYIWAFRALFGRDAVIEIVAMLKLKHPRIETHEVTRSDQELAWFVQLAIEIARAIEAGVFPPSPSWSCPSCEFADQCRAMRGGT